MDTILIITAAFVFFVFLSWSVWVAHYATHQYPLDKRLNEVIRR